MGGGEGRIANAHAVAPRLAALALGAAVFALRAPPADAHPLCILTTKLSTTLPAPADGATVPYHLEFCEITKAFSAQVTAASLPVDPATFVPGSGAWTSCPETCSIDSDGTLRIAPFIVGAGLCVAFDLTLTLEPGQRGQSVYEQGATTHNVLGGQFACDQPTDDPSTAATADPTCVKVQDSAPGCVINAVVDPPFSTTCAGFAVTLSASASTATGCPGSTLAWQWQKDGLDMPGETASDHVAPATTLPSAASYRCRVSCAGLPDCRTLSNPSLVILEGPGPIDAPDTACVGQPTAVAVESGVTCSIDCGNGDTPVPLCAASCTYTAPGSHTITADATDANACELVQTRPIQVISQVKACIGALADLCESPAGGPTVLTLRNCSVPGITSAWTTSFGTLGDASAREPTLSLPDVSIPTPVTVSLTASAAGCGVPDQASATFTLEPTPQASLSATPDPGCASSPVTFTAPALGSPGPFTWSWDFGDGNGSTQPSPTHSYVVNGTYLVTATVTDISTGCSAQVSHSLIVVRDCCAAALPAMTGLMLVKRPNPIDITLSWDSMPAAVDGFDVWEARDKRDIPISRVPGGSGLSEVCLRDLTTTCTLTGWVTGLPGTVDYYTGHGVCAGSEGP